MSRNKFTLAEHFQELKIRTLYVLGFFVISFVGSYIFSEKIYAILLKPLSLYYEQHNQTGGVIYTGLAEAFLTYLKISFFSAIFLTVPFLVIHLFLFISPGLTLKEKRITFAFCISVPILFCVGAFVAYYFIFPAAWSFFLSFENTSLDGMPIRLEARVIEYLELSSQIILAFGLAFQLPVVIFILNKIDLLKVDFLKKKRRFVVVFIFLMAAIITPPDVFSQLILAAIMILLYEFAILACILFNKE